MNDFRFAFRQLWKTPGFTFAAVTVLDLGIWVYDEIMSDLDGGMNKPLTNRAADNLMLIGRLKAGMTAAAAAPALQGLATNLEKAFPVEQKDQTLTIAPLDKFTTSTAPGHGGPLGTIGGLLADVLRLVVRQGMGPVVIGLIAGLGAAIALGTLLASQLDQVSAHNPLLLAATAATLAIIALLACLIPARRATLVNPIEALRTE